MGRSPCCEKAHTNRGAWTKEEDDRLVSYIRAHGKGCWRSLPKAAGLFHCGKSCRLRWINYLRPDLKRGNFTPQEDDLIIKLHSVLGNKWSLIAGRLPGRTDNEIKNYWNTHIRKKLLNIGIDPATHRPVNEPTETATVKEEFLNIATESICKEEKEPVLIERFPDLNLALRISPPCQIQIQQGSSCFNCRLGLQSSKDCSCSLVTVSKSVANANSAYDFLGLKAGVLDYTSLQMK